MKLTSKQAQSLAKLIDYNFDEECRHFEEEYDVDTNEMTQQEIIELCEKEGYTDHIFYHILVVS